MCLHSEAAIFFRYLSNCTSLFYLVFAWSMLLYFLFFRILSYSHVNYGFISKNYLIIFIVLYRQRLTLFNSSSILVFSPGLIVEGVDVPLQLPLVCMSGGCFTGIGALSCRVHGPLIFIKSSSSPSYEKQKGL